MVRYKYIDCIKAISIILVVYCHYPLISVNSFIGNVGMIIATLGVPCFFMCSGAVMLNQTNISMKKLINKIVIVYLVNIVWRYLYLILFCLVDHLSFKNIEIINFIFLFGNLSGIDTGHLWFINAYLEVLIIFPVLWKLFITNEAESYYFEYLLGILISFGFILPTLLQTLNILEINEIYIAGLQQLSLFGNHFNMVVYYMIGAILQKKYVHEKFMLQKSVLILIVLLSIIALICFKYFQTKSFLWDNTYLSEGYSKLSTIAMSSSIFLIFQQINYTESTLSRTLQMIGKNTLGIYYMHMALLNLLYRKVNDLVEISLLPLNIVKTIGVVFLCLIITKCLKVIPIIRRLVL